MPWHNSVARASLVWNKARNRFEAWKQIYDILRRCTIYWRIGGADGRTSACGRDKSFLVRVRSDDIRHWRTLGPSRTFGDRTRHVKALLTSSKGGLAAQTLYDVPIESFTEKRHKTEENLHDRVHPLPL